LRYKSTKTLARLSVLLLLVAAACSGNTDAPKSLPGPDVETELNGMTSLEKETLGGFTVGTETKDLFDKLGEPDDRRIDKEEDAATSCFHTEWLYTEQGLSFGIAATGKGRARYVGSLPLRPLWQAMTGFVGMHLAGARLLDRKRLVSERASCASSTTAATAVISSRSTRTGARRMACANYMRTR